VQAEELKEWIFKNKKIPFILETIGCKKIKYHSNKHYYSCTNYEGDKNGDSNNDGAVKVKNDKYLSCKNYTRQKYFDERSDLITLIEYSKNLKFREALKYLHQILGLEFTYKSKEINKIDPLYIFKKVQNKKFTQNVLDFEPLDEGMLNDFIPHIHIEWFREGIIKKTIDKFGLAYSYRYKRNIIPLRYWLTGELLGFNMRTTVENYELFGIKKYLITPNYPKQINLFGLWENYESIQKAGYVVVQEAEKSVLKRDSLNDETSVAMSGHTLSDEQIKILIGLNVTIILSFDKDISLDEIRYNCEKFYGIRTIYYIYDKYGLLGEKDSPADANNKVFQYLMKYKIKYDEKEHNEYIKSLKKVGK